MDRARVDAWLARIISGLLVVILVTAPLLFGALREEDFFWIQLLGIIAGVLWVLRLWLTPQKILLPHIIWPLLAFCVYAMARYFTADVEILARRELIRVLFYMMFFVLALNHFKNARAADIAAGILIVLGMALSVYALRQYLTGTSTIWNLSRPDYAFRGSGTFIYPNHFAGFTEMLLALGFAYVFLGASSKWARIALAYCSLWLLVGIYFSFSRAGWVATLGAIVVLSPILLRNRQRQVVAFVLLVGLLVGGLIWELKTHQITNRLEGLGQDDPTTGFNARRALWTGARNMWRDHPVLGAGPGHFDERFRTYRTRHFQMTAGHAHSDYLQVLAEWGTVGAALLLCALTLYLWPATLNWIKTALDPTALNAATTNHFALTCGGFAGTLALLAHSLVDYQWYAPGVMLTFIAIIAIVLSRLQPRSFNARIPVSVLMLAAVVFQSIQATKTIREDHWLDEANVAASLEARIEQLKRAYAIEPQNFLTAYRIGETYRAISWEGAENYKEMAEQAIRWFDVAARLNRFDPYPPMRKAMCLDWLKRHKEAEVEIQKALALDPEHYLVLAIAGWHYFQVEDNEKSLDYFQKSYVRNWRNPMIPPYFERLRERAEAKKKN